MEHPPQPDCLSFVLDLNVQGILKMQQGDYIAAGSCFHKGCSIAINQLAMFGAFPTAIDKPSWMNQEETGDEDDFLEDQEATLHSVTLPEETHPKPHDDTFMLFNRAIHLPREADFFDGDQAQLGKVASAVLLYNMGFSLHMHGLSTGDSKCLARAIDLYSIAYNTYVSLKEATPGSRFVDLGLLAATNNMGHIFAFFRCFQETSLCSDDLSYRLFGLTNALSIDHNNHPVLDEEYKVFFLNACFFRESVFVSAPAA